MAGSALESCVTNGEAVGSAESRRHLTITIRVHKNIFGHHISKKFVVRG